jgi:hypothetical protein
MVRVSSCQATLLSDYPPMPRPQVDTGNDLAHPREESPQVSVSTGDSDRQKKPETFSGFGNWW